MPPQKDYVCLTKAKKNCTIFVMPKWVSFLFNNSILQIIIASIIM